MFISGCLKLQEYKIQQLGVILHLSKQMWIIGEREEAYDAKLSYRWFK